jgi:hypothetical protein
MQLPKTFFSGGRRLFEIKFAKCKEKALIKARYKNNITTFVKQCSLGLITFLR